MSRIRADRIVNRAANGPVEVSEGISIPSDKKISISGNFGNDGQYLKVTETGLEWDAISYSNLEDKPTLFSGSYNDLTNKPSLFSGSYNDLTDTPTISYTDLTDTPILFSGSYNDLNDRPPNISVVVDTPGTSSLLFNSQTSVLTYTPPNLNNFIIRNTSDSLTSLSIQTSLSSPEILANEIRSIASGAVSFLYGIAPSSIIAGNTAGSSGQFLRATETGIEWSTVNLVAENSSPSFSNVNVTGDLNVVGTITTNNLTTLNVTNSQIVLNDSVTEAPTSNADIIVNRGTSPDTSLRWNELSDRWEFTNDGSTYSVIPLPSEYNNYNNLINKPVIPAPQVQVDWNSTIGISSILNKPELFSGSYNDLTDKPSIPLSLGDLSNVSNNIPSTGNVLRWDGNEWVPSVAGGGDGGGTLLGPVSSTDKAIPRYNGSSGLELQDSLVTITDTGAIQAPRVENLIPFYYPTVAELPNASINAGAFAFVNSGNAMYYASNSSWTNNRVVTTTSTTTSDLQTLIGDFQKTYTVSAVDYTIGNSTQNAERKILRLSDSGGTTDDIVLRAVTGLNISRTSDEITLTGRTYSLTTESASGNSTKLRFTETGLTTSSTDITFAGADGLIVERTDSTTITFRAPANTVTQYTDDLAKDAVANALINGTNVGITYTYDSINKVINSNVSGGGGETGTVITYDFLGRNTTSNNAILDLVPSTGTTDSIEIAGSGGTTVTWDSLNNKITLGSIAPVQSDWNQTNTNSLDFIKNKPTIPPAYTLPTASTTVLGGVKVDGSTITISNGTISAASGGYVLPIASPTTLGGIKIGSGLSIDANGVVNASAGSSVATIQELSNTTESINPQETAELNIVGYKAYTLFKINTTEECWVRIYSDSNSRTLDITRSEGEDPAPGSGIITEIRTDGITNSVLITPGVLGFNNDNPRTTTIYLAVTNRSSSATSITVTLTALKIGE
jgi:hypothetical protein